MLGLAEPVFAAVEVTGLRIWHAPDRNRLVFELSGPVKPKVFSLANPSRLVLDLPAAELKTVFPSGSMGPMLKGVRSGEPRAGVLRLVLDLHKPAAFRVFTIAAAGDYKDRLVVNLNSKNADEAGSRSSIPKPDDLDEGYVVVVDAGHGGEDPGAIGFGGLREKDIVLDIARRLARMIEKEPGMVSFSTRTADYYVRLRRRVDVARKAKASIFVSIHADAFRSRSARGASVYSLSQSGATSEMAAYLAQRENAADLAGGISLSDRDKDLAEVMLDMQLDWKIEESRLLGSQILSALGTLSPLHTRQVEQAGFAVLKAPAIPSVLIEVGYVTHPGDSKRLKNSGFQEQLAAAIFRGILAYCHMRPRCPLLETINKTHVVKTGDSLSEIAVQYGSNVETIKRWNGLLTNVIRVRQKLIIPIAVP